MASARDVYKRMLRDELSPRLRALGFKGSRGVYERPSPSHWVVLGVQASQFSGSDEVKFTVNCQVVAKDVWDAARFDRGHLGRKPKPNTVAGNFVWWARIGSLMPGGQDHWWSLTTSSDGEAVAQDVADAVRLYAVPAMDVEIGSTMAT